MTSSRSFDELDAASAEFMRLAPQYTVRGSPTQHFRRIALSCDMDPAFHYEFQQWFDEPRITCEFHVEAAAPSALLDEMKAIAASELTVGGMPIQFGEKPRTRGDKKWALRVTPLGQKPRNLPKPCSNSFNAPAGPLAELRRIHELTPVAA